MNEENEQTALVEQSSEGSFSRNYTMYGLLIVVMLCTIWLWNILLIGVILFATLALYFIGEFRLHKNIHDLMSIPNTTISRPKFLISSIFIFGISAFCFLIYEDTIPFIKIRGQPLSFTVTYERSLLLTVSFSLSFLGFRLLFIALNIMDLIEFECGLYGLIYRIIFIVRTLIVTGSWIQYFAEDEDATFRSVFLSDKLSLPGFYIAIKALFMAMLIWDLGSSRVKYKCAKKKALKRSKGVCDCCGKECKFVLQCGHKLCLSCRKHKISTSPFCPTCIQEVCKPVRFAFTDGYSSVASIFCCV